MTRNDWFTVDRAGLAKILRRRGIEFAVFELIQNAWDEDGVTQVIASLERTGDNGRALLTVEDNSAEGFKDLSHAFTLFAESGKKADATKRGRFNLGEKLVLALCVEATITTTKGTITFGKNGRRVNRCKQMDRGSRVELLLGMSKGEVERVCEEVRKLIPPRNIATTFNGATLATPKYVTFFEATLPTELADAEGNLRACSRMATVHVHPVADGDTARIYEMGIPVVEHDCAFHVDVQQKVPVTLDRENVTPRFLRKLRTAVFNATHMLVTPEQATAEWAQTAIESPDAAPEAVADYMTKRFGEKRVSYDPSDPEANKRATSEGYTVVHGGMLSGAAWTNVRQFEAIKPAGQVTPSAKLWNGEDNPNAQAATPIPPEKWSGDMHAVAEYAREFARATINETIFVEYYSEMAMLAAASYGNRTLSFNKLRLGNAFFDLDANRERIDDLLIHELGHEYSGDHLSEDYYRALTKIGARAVQAAREGKL